MAKYKVREGYSVVLSANVAYTGGMTCELTDDQYKSHRWKVDPVKTASIPDPTKKVEEKIEEKAVKEGDVVNRAMSTEKASSVVKKGR